ncbi:MAG: AAA family ATPase [Zoogloeaceae bacterium]|jgi:chromosome segregation protein|nr:AAA family ATPase [Zoogloeaceae bacterium]
MRLTKLKLAGFKSFVDPVTVLFPGQLVGVVGPNGCGKSNIMDAVRWVLGESRASELRGESMQDVIFNGASDRKPVARASVELVFDNTLGSALGQWSQYAELAVKRVLTRNGHSDYFINNLKVRRKDITELFLGTGLGPRAYAIIGQGMISRVIEARPDDLRVFLEEAAGVTRYKERRKETEGRLEDARENLARVEDIRRELASQMERLESQAEVARRHHECSAALTQKQQFLWLLRKNEAQAGQQKLALEVSRADAELEAEIAALRKTEAALDAARESHFAASDAVHRAQSALYAVNAEAARLEAEIRHRQEVERQLAARLAQLASEEAHWQARTEKLLEEKTRWQSLRDLADARQETAEARQAADGEVLQQARTEQEAARAEADRLRREAARAEQELQVERTHREHAERN